MKRLLISASIIAIAAMPALAQAPAPTPPSPAPVAQSQRPGEINVQRLLGRTVRNLQDETVGDVNSVILSGDGAVSAVIVGVGGFLGIGEHEVAIRWQDLQIRNNGDDVRTSLTKDAVRALPEYRYAEGQQRGTVITQPAQRTAPTGTTAAPQQGSQPTDRAAPQTTARAVGPTADSLSVNAIIGATVRDGRNESIGRVYDIIMDARGTPQTIVISVGGVLGMGGRRAAVPLRDVHFTRDGDSVVLSTSLTTEQLQQMPEYQPR